MECLDHRHRLLRLSLPGPPCGEGLLRRVHGVFVAGAGATLELGFLSEELELEAEIEPRVFYVCCVSNVHPSNELGMP